MMYWFLLLKSKATTEDFKFVHGILNLLAKVLMLGVYCFPIFILVVGIFTKNSMETVDNHRFICTVRVNWIIPATLGVLDLMFNAGFFYLFFMPLKDIIRSLNTTMRVTSMQKEGWSSCKWQGRTSLLLSAPFLGQSVLYS
jgi:hypothetical protein